MRLLSRATDFLSPLAGDFEGKGLPDPAGEERAPAPDVYGTTLFSTAGSRYSGSTARRQLEIYGAGNANSVDWVADCVDVIAQTAATADWHLENEEGQEVPRHRGEAEKGARLADPWLVQLLAEPNPEMLWEELVELAFIDYIITGDAIIYKRGDDGEGRPLALYRLNPALVEVLPGRRGQRASKYKYSVPGGEPIEIDADKIIHWRMTNPHDPYRGVGLIAKGPRIFDQEIALTETKTSFFENSGRLSGVLESDSVISDTYAQKLRRQFQGLYAGVAKAFQVAVLGRGLKYQTIQANAQEAEFVALTEASRDRIMAALRVPRAKLGIPNDNSSTTTPAEERRTFANDVMRPMLNEFQALMTRDLVAQWGLKLRIKYEYQMPIEDQFKLAGEFAKAPGVTVAEVRERYGLAKLAEILDDEAEAKKIEEMVLNMPGENDNASEVKDRNLPGEGGRPPKGENTATFNDGSASSDAAISG